MNNQDSRESIRERGYALIKEAENLFRLADFLYPLTDEERIERENAADDAAFNGLLKRIFELIKLDGSISAAEVSGAMGLPTNHPKKGSHQLATLLLKHMEDESFLVSAKIKGVTRWEAVSNNFESTRLYRIK